MSDVAAGVGFFFSNPAPAAAPTENSDEDIDGHGAALASSGYNLHGMTGHYVVNPAGNIQITNNMNMMGAQNNNNGAVLMMNMDNLPCNQNPLQSNPTSTAGGMNFGNFLFNPLAMFYHQHQVQTAPQAAAAGAAAAGVATPPPAAPTSTLMHQPQNNQYFTPAQSPMPQAFFTPRTGTPYSGSPSQTPPPPTSPSPQVQPSALPQSLLPTHSSLSTANNTNNNKRKTPDDDDSPSRSLIRQGFSSVGSALGVVATYINKSLQNGIPFHIADRAMKDSKETYSRWWDQTVVSDDNKYDRTRKGSTDDEIDDDDEDDDSADDERAQQPVRKKRKTGVDEEYGRASSLSQMLAGNYNDANIEAVKKNWRVGKSEVIQAQVVPDVRVDSSIIGPPRRQTSNAASTCGYDAFNNVGSMYGGDMFFDNNTTVENNINTTIESDIGKYSTTYDSMSGYYVNSTEEDERKLASVPSSVKKYESSTTGNNTLGQTLQAIKEIIEEKNRVSDEQEIFQMSFKSPRDWVTRTIRSELVDALQSVQGDVTTKRFMSSLEVLTRFYKASGRDARANPWNVGGPAGADILEGSWLNISRPNYVECLGQNTENDFMYTLGRMSFDMFQPSNLICSVQSTHNTIKMIGEREELPACVPNSLKNEVASLSNSSDADSASKRPLLRSYDIAVSMTIEPPSLVGQPNPNTTPSPTKRMRAVMSVKGYILPDPNIRNRLTVWFTGGRLGPAKLSQNDGDETDDEDENIGSEGNEYGGFKEWEVIFGKGKWRKAISERARDMAAKVLLGVDMPNKMEDDGHMEYSLNRPIGGHGKTYIDVLYLDDDILIMKGHHGTIYAMARSCVSQRYRNLQASIAKT